MFFRMEMDVSDVSDFVNHVLTASASDKSYASVSFLFVSFVFSVFRKLF